VNAVQRRHLELGEIETLSEHVHTHDDAVVAAPDRIEDRLAATGLAVNQNRIEVAIVSSVNPIEEARGCVDGLRTRHQHVVVTGVEVPA